MNSFMPPWSLLWSGNYESISNYKQNFNIYLGTISNEFFIITHFENICNNEQDQKRELSMSKFFHKKICLSKDVSQAS